MKETYTPDDILKTILDKRNRLNEYPSRIALRWGIDGSISGYWLTWTNHDKVCWSCCGGSDWAKPWTDDELCELLELVSLSDSYKQCLDCGEVFHKYDLCEGTCENCDEPYECWEMTQDGPKVRYTIPRKRDIV